MLDNARGLPLGKGLYLDPIGPLDVLIQMEIKVAMGQLPSILAAEAQGHIYGKLMALPTCESSLMENTYNSHQCTMTVHTPEQVEIR